MNLLLLSNKFPYPPRDGGALATLNMARGMAQLGHHAVLLAINTQKHPGKTEEIPEKIRSAVSMLGVDHDTTPKPLAALGNFFFSAKPYNATRFESVQYRQTLAGLLENENFDVIQMEGPYLQYCIPLIRRHFSGLLSLRAHNLEHEIWRGVAEATSGLGKKSYLRNLAWRLRRFETCLLDRIDALIPISEADEQKFTDMGWKGPTQVIPAGLTREYPEPRWKRDLSIGYLGALDWEPNVHGLKWFVREVLPAIRERFPGIAVHVAGRNPDQKTAVLLDERPVTFHGEIENARDFINRHPVMVVPVFSGSGIRIKILEAMALGRVVITTRKGIEGIPAQNNRHIIIADTAREMLRQISYLVQDPGRIRKLGMEAIRFVRENFDNFENSKKLMAFYKSHIQ